MSHYSLYDRKVQVCLTFVSDDVLTLTGVSEATSVIFLGLFAPVLPRFHETSIHLLSFEKASFFRIDLHAQFQTAGDRDPNLQPAGEWRHALFWSTWLEVAGNSWSHRYPSKLKSGASHNHGCQRPRSGGGGVFLHHYNGHQLLGVQKIQKNWKDGRGHKDRNHYCRGSQHQRPGRNSNPDR